MSTIVGLPDTLEDHRNLPGGRKRLPRGRKRLPRGRKRLPQKNGRLLSSQSVGSQDGGISNLQNYDKWIQSSCMGSPTPRLQQWFATCSHSSHSSRSESKSETEEKGADMSYKFGGRRYQPETYPEWLTVIQRHINTLVSTFFSSLPESPISRGEFRPPNSVLINKYRDGNDKIQWHTDNNPEFGEKPTIISVNVGQTRRFCIKPIPLHADQRVARSATKTFHLQHGDILIIAGSRTLSSLCPQRSRAFPCRYNLTFRPYTKTTLLRGRKRKRPAPVAQTVSGPRLDAIPTTTIPPKLTL